MTRLNIVAWNNGGGLSRDIHILQGILTTCGYLVHVNGEQSHQLPLHRDRETHRDMNANAEQVRIKRQSRPAYDANLFLEEILLSYIPYARKQILIPNPEWFRPDSEAALPQIDVIFCKTKNAQAIFNAMGQSTRYIGFTSLDRFEPTLSSPNPLSFLHLAGRSWQKGTSTLVDLWYQRPDWPPLTLVQSPTLADGTPTQPIQERGNINHLLQILDDTTLRRYQNQHQVHLCPSEAEGFGHVLVEAMSCAALVLTTDAPPMNELVTPARGIVVSYHRTRPQHRGTVYEIDPQDLEHAIDRVIQLTAEARHRLGTHARAWYHRNHVRFRQRLVTALTEMGLRPTRNPL